MVGLTEWRASMASAIQFEPRVRPRSPVKPAVLFFDDYGCKSFDQLAGALKLRGIAALRLRVPPLASRPTPPRFTRAGACTALVLGRRRRGPGTAYGLLVRAKAGKLLIERLACGLANTASGGPAPEARRAGRGSRRAAQRCAP